MGSKVKIEKNCDSLPMARVELRDRLKVARLKGAHSSHMIRLKKTMVGPIVVVIDCGYGIGYDF